ncbi:ergothioneine biosynthesis protein EgtC [Nocardia wallacei]|uniref:ergothioneine biosynthesis protein EgtC n=1 Tax=Nocardia wallacei TaxID=480035 RepID=UPI002453C431|nr:ergothioneine biosynthesis protein EgtC [Nocardia wallacei]
MCRHLGYLGPPAPVGALLTRGEHSLRSQAWQPRDMRGGGTINADGFGVAWWVPVVEAGGASSTGDRARSRGPEAASARMAGRIGGRSPITLAASRYRNPAPIWTDPAVDEVLPQLRSTAVLAAVRSATVGMPVERSACAPFTHGRWAFSHNGVVQDWQRVLTEVAAELGVATLLDAESHTDSALLWVILRDLLEKLHEAAEFDRVPIASNGAAPAADGYAIAETPESWTLVADDWPESAAVPGRALRLLVSAVLARAPRARLNLLLSDGETLWATTVYHSLSVLATDTSVTLSSEPYDDDPRWQAIADRQLVTARPGHLSVVPLASAESERASS